MMINPSPRRIAAEPSLRDRRGFALMLALGAVVVVALLIVGVSHLSSQQLRAGTGAMTQERAFRLAEAGLNQRVSAWSDVQANALALPVGGALPATAIPIPNVPVAARPVVQVSRLTAALFQVTSQSTVGQGPDYEASRRVSQIVRIMSPTFNILGALTVRGDTKIGGSSFIDGDDSNPTGWTCPAAGASKAGIVIADSDDIETSGCNNFNCLDGNPKIAENAAAGNASTYSNFGDFDWAGLVALRSVNGVSNSAPQPAFLNGTCNRAVQTNWGDVNRLIPSGVCESYFPIIYFAGDAKLTGGSGQGIMLVEGDLEVTGAFKFYGPVIVKGRLKTAGTGGHFNGAVMAANVDLEQNSVLGNAIVNYSSCAVASAVLGAGQAMPVRQRPWVEMY